MNKKDLMKTFSIDAVAADSILSHVDNNLGKVSAGSNDILDIPSDLTPAEYLCCQIALLEGMGSQKCGDSFKTSGQASIKYKDRLSFAETVPTRRKAYEEALGSAKTFCIVDSQSGCRTPKFVSYDTANYKNTPNEGGGGTYTVNYIVVWKCVKEV